MKATLLLALPLFLFSVFPAQGFAQEGDYFEMEDPEEFIEPIPEPYYEEEPIDDFEMGGPPPPPPPPEEYEEPPTNTGRPTFRRPQQPTRPSRPASRPATSGEIEFRLMDPPKFYVGEKKPPLPKPKSLKK